MTCIQAMVQGLPLSWVGGSGSEMANGSPTTPTPRSPYLPSASGHAFGDKLDPGLVFFLLGGWAVGVLACVGGGRGGFPGTY